MSGYQLRNIHRIFLERKEALAIEIEKEKEVSRKHYLNGRYNEVRILEIKFWKLLEK